MTEATEILHLSEAEMVELERKEHAEVYAQGGDLWALNSHWMNLWSAWNVRHPERGNYRSRPQPAPESTPEPTPATTPEESDEDLYFEL
jgi:hypothetical protein